MRGARSDQRVVNERSAGSTQLIEKVGSSESCGLLKDSRSWRQMQAEGFVVAVLYGTLVDEDVPLRAWLADDLVVVFESLVIDRVYGTESRLLATAPDMLPPDVPSGRRPKRAGPSLEGYAHWYYRSRVADPPATLTMLATERLKNSATRREGSVTSEASIGRTQKRSATVSRKRGNCSN